MTEHGERTAAVRDVPPPRPVPSAPGAAPAAEGTAARAGRLLADAVGGLLGRGVPAAAVLRDVAAAVTTAARRVASPARPAEGGAGPFPGAVVGDLLAAAAPHLPVRDAATLRAEHPGLSDDEIADALVARAARLTTAIGAATGGIFAASWLAPPSLLALPLELGAETAAVAAVEVVLVAELHELAGRPAPGDARARAAAYLAAWTDQRAVDSRPGAGIPPVLGTAGLRALQRHVGRRLARSLPVAAPFLVGAALGGRGNRRATEALARRLRADLRRHLP
ncbi:hypothetical protein [Geodermatophilus marinus]|uniref:hypothetical protein n=1 Tax=Geodermatophilus sp. LHW52908 TaxID=2303986 RepID=UPI000E3B78BB|nr:hypothetical protein [Geodermatophilus sp. LHW52908]RFU19016.1 hypothetical protein D0Z06_23730 [Geodermatophilus sp. LHW52908]